MKVHNIRRWGTGSSDQAETHDAGRSGAAANVYLRPSIPFIDRIKRDNAVHRILQRDLGPRRGPRSRSSATCDFKDKEELVTVM